MSSHSGFTVLLTATIDPGSTLYVRRRDPAVRRGDYKTALRRWMDEPEIGEIIFCENSGADLSDIVAMARSHPRHLPVTFLSYRAPESDGQRGKGYAELGIIERVLSKHAFGRTSHVLKVTGRYNLQNFREVAADIQGRKELDVMTFPSNVIEFLPSGCLYCSLEFMRNFLLPQREFVDDHNGFCFEHALARAVTELKTAGGSHGFFSSPSQVIGISGTSNLPSVLGSGDGWIEIAASPDYLALFHRVLHREQRQTCGTAANDDLSRRIDLDSAGEARKVRLESEDLIRLRRAVESFDEQEAAHLADVTGLTTEMFVRVVERLFSASDYSNVIGETANRRDFPCDVAVPNEIHDGYIHVWTTVLDEGDGSDRSSWLSEAELQEADGLVCEADRRRFIRIRAFLRRVLARYLGLGPAEIEFTKQANGKPAVADRSGLSALRFSFSHCERLAMVAVTSQSAVGVDIEAVRPVPEYMNLAKDLFAEEDYTALAAVPEAERCRTFLRYWTRREAMIQALEPGSSEPRDPFKIPLMTDGRGSDTVFEPGVTSCRDWTVVNIEPLEHLVGAIAAPFPDAVVKGFQMAANDAGI